VAEAAREHEQSERIEPGDVEDSERLAFLYAERFDDPGEAVHVLDQLVRADRGSPRKLALAHLARSRYFAGRDQPDRAAAEVDQAVKADPSSVEVRLAAAESAIRRGDAEAARQHLRAVSPSARNDLRVDPRGVYAVDLVTRTGTRSSGTGQLVGRLRPGDWLEVAGRRVELLGSRIDGIPHSPPPCDIDLLADTSLTTPVGVSLEPRRPAGRPWVLGSELVFLGRSASCGIPVKDRAVSRTHCALLRTSTAAYVVDLYGQHTRIDDRPLRGGSIVRDGQVLMLGSTAFFVHVEPAAAGLNALALLDGIEISDGPRLPAPLEMISPGSQQAILAWMMGTIQRCQGEALRQQGDFQLAMTHLLRQIQQDNATLLDAHLSRLENVDRELASLRAELERRGTHTAPPLRNQGTA
jgi:tetratricopeptide (TPR) repeat protein